MKLKSYEIDSYRSCLRTKSPLQDTLTGLIGINGSGKSNILNSLVLLKKMVRSRPLTRDEDSPSRNKCRITAEIEYQKKTLFMRGIIEYETDEHNHDEVYSSQLKFNFREFLNYPKWINIPLQLFSLTNPFSTSINKPLMDSRWMDIIQYYHINQEDFNFIRTRRIGQLLNAVFNFFDGINYYSASQFSDPSRCPVSMELEENRPSRRVRVGGVGHERFIFDLYQSWKAKNIQFKRYINTVGNEGIGLVDNVQFTEIDIPSSSYEVTVGGKIQKIERNRLLVVPNFSINNIELSPNQLSEGTFKTLALVYYILNDDSKLLLIEEPEVCVHHGLLSSIISLIKTQSKQKQIVMSTHSDFVLDHLEPENLLQVKWIPNKGTIATPLNRAISKNDYKELKIYLKESGNLGEYWKESGFEND